MPRLVLFYRLIVRPLLRDPWRTLLMVFAVVVGVSVVLAIELAGTRRQGPFDLHKKLSLGIPISK